MEILVVDDELAIRKSLSGDRPRKKVVFERFSAYFDKLYGQ